MICPNCGAQLEEGKLICEVCASEIKIVPDFEPEIEDKIEESISNLVQGFTDEDLDQVLAYKDSVTDDEIIEELNPDDIFSIPDEDLPDDDFWDVEDVIDLKKGNSYITNFIKSLKKNIKTRIIVIFCGVICLAALVFTIGIVFNQRQSSGYEAYLEKAQNCYSNGNYSDAVMYLEQAILKDNSDRSLKYLLADYYLANSQIENAITTIKDLISNPDENVEVAYDKLISIYIETERYSDIVDCLSNCDNRNVYDKYQSYLASNPEFGSSEGEYDAPIYLKMTANTSGHIYYTLDGSEPTVESSEYTSPIFLEFGYYTISAFFVNDYGISSEIVTGVFSINSSIPPAPVILTEEGEYTLPTLIELELEEEYLYSTFYTMDGTVPTKDSLVYSGPIVMPLGTTLFSFVSYNVDDIASEVSIASYTLNLEGATLSKEEAVNQITNYRFSLGGMNDLEGHLDSIEGRILYKCNSAVYINGDVFYVISEYYEDPTTLSQIKTGLNYGVCIHDINCFSEIEEDENGNFYLR